MGFGSDVIAVRVSPCGDTFFVVEGLVVNEIYIGDYWNISAQIELYRRLSEYISDYSNISTFRQKTTTIVNLIFSFIVESLE